MGLRQDLGKPLARLLVVDDLVMLRQGVKILLEDAGFEVQEAGSGEEALEVLKVGSFDLVMTDLSMPGLSGLEWVRRAGPPKEGRPIYLMLSAKVEPRDVEEAKTLGIQEVLHKPYRREALVGKIDQLLGVDRQRILKEIEERQAARRAEAKSKRESDQKAAEKDKDKRGPAGEPGGRAPQAL